MENRKEEFLKIVCQSYLIVILAVLPLYYIPWNGYYKLGDTKYYLYRNISVTCRNVKNTCGNDGGLPVRNLCVTLCNLQPLWQYRVERRAGMVHGSCHDLFDDRRFFTDGEVRR